LLIQEGAFGVGGEEGRVFLRGHVKVLIDFSGLAKLQLQHSLLGSVADACDASGLDRNSLHLDSITLWPALTSWMRFISDKARGISD